MTNTNTTRRTLLCASSALLAPGFIALPVGAATDSPVLALYRQWEALEAAIDDGQDDDEGGRLFTLMIDVERRIAETPCRTMQDLAAKVLVLTGITDRGPTLHEAAVESECEAILAGGAA